MKIAVAEAQRQTTIEAVEWIKTYPPETIANSPNNPSGRWYARGFGPRWRRRGGTGGRNTSEQLGTRWVTTPTGGPNAIGSTIRNTASYARYVHSAEKQPRFHAQRGWRTDKGLVDWLKTSGRALELVRAAMARVLRGGA